MPSDLVCVRTFIHRHEADLAQSILQANGIPGMISAQDQGGLAPHLLTGSGGVQLIVRAEDADAARQVLDDDPVDVTEYTDADFDQAFADDSADELPSK